MNNEKVVSEKEIIGTLSYMDECVDKNYGGKHIGNYMLQYILDVYKKKLFKKVVLDVLTENPSAIKLYQNLGFEKFTEVFKGFSNPKKERPDVFSMITELE